MGNLIYSPRTHPAQAADPTSQPLDQPLYICAFNQQYAPYILGALEVLVQDEYWLSGLAPDRIADLFLGLSAVTPTPNTDQKNGIFRAAGVTLNVAQLNFTGQWEIYRAGFDNQCITALVPSKPGVMAGVRITSTGIDSGLAAAAAKWTSVRSWIPSTLHVTAATIVYVEHGNPTPVTVTNADIRDVLTGKFIVSADITVLGGQFGMSIDVRGPDVGA